MKSYISKNHIDSIDVNLSGKRIIMGVSSLDGNTWDGGLSLLSTDGTEICSKYSQAGISMVRYSGTNLILAARDDGNVIIYSSDKLEELQVLGIHDDIVSCVIDDPHNESHFASCGWDGSVHLWDWRHHQEPKLSYIKAHHGHVNGIAYSPYDPNVFCSAGWDGFVRIWDKRENPSSGCASIINVDQICSCISYESKDENTLLVGTSAGDISVIDHRGGNSASKIISATHIHEGSVRRILASPQPRSGLFISASDDTTYAICKRNNEEVIEKKRISCHSDYVTDVAWTCSSDGSTEDTVYSVSTDKSLQKNKIDMSAFIL